MTTKINTPSPTEIIAQEFIQYRNKNECEVEPNGKNKFPKFKYGNQRYEVTELPEENPDVEESQIEYIIKDIQDKVKNSKGKYFQLIIPTPPTDIFKTYKKQIENKIKNSTCLSVNFVSPTNSAIILQ
jgi:hypothetical protein